jgi:hypothetical protein
MMIDVDWWQPFIDYIREQKVPNDKNLAEQIISQAKFYVPVGDKLYRRGATSRVPMKCVPREGGMDILEKIHRASPSQDVTRWSARLSDKLSTGPQLWEMLRNSSEGAKGVSSSPSNSTSRPTS